MQILVFGDSIAFGQCDPEGGWVTRLKKYLYKKSQDIQIYNFGIPGNTTDDVIKRLESDLKPRLEPPVIFIFAIGINDSYLLLKENNKIKVSPNQFRKNLQKLIGMSQRYSSQIIFLGLTPVDEKRAIDEESFYKNENIKNYDLTIKDICITNRIYYINILSQWEKTNYNTLLEDGLHPNSLGHKKIFKTVRDFLLINKLA